MGLVFRCMEFEMLGRQPSGRVPKLFGQILCRWCLELEERDLGCTYWFGSTQNVTQHIEGNRSQRVNERKQSDYILKRGEYWATAVCRDKAEEHESTKWTKMLLSKSEEESPGEWSITQAKGKQYSMRRDWLTIKCYRELKCDKDRRVFIDATAIATDSSGRHQL